MALAERATSTLPSRRSVNASGASVRDGSNSRQEQGDGNYIGSVREVQGNSNSCESGTITPVPLSKQTPYERLPLNQRTTQKGNQRREDPGGAEAPVEPGNAAPVLPGHGRVPERSQQQLDTTVGAGVKPR